MKGVALPAGAAATAAAAAAAATAAAALAGCGSSSPKTVTVSTAGGAAKKPTAAPRAKKPTGTTAAKTTTAGAPITTTGAPATPPAPVLHLTTFRSPSGNIGCELVTAFARCDIANREWKPPPKPAGCPLDYGQGLEVGRSGPGRLVCAGDTALNPQARALPYGLRSRAGVITCTSARTGMSCTNHRTHHGFFISAQRYSAF